MRHATLIAGVLLTSAASTAQAQLIIEPSDEMVKQAAQAVRANITLARLADGSQVPAETDAELAVPLAQFELEKQTVRRGVLSGELQACGDDWQQSSFQPYMDRMREARKLNDKQLAYIGMLHGFVQGQVHEALRTRIRGCSNGNIERLRKMAAEPLRLP